MKRKFRAVQNLHTSAPFHINFLPSVNSLNSNCSSSRNFSEFRPSLPSAPSRIDLSHACRSTSLKIYRKRQFAARCSDCQNTKARRAKIRASAPRALSPPLDFQAKPLTTLPVVVHIRLLPSRNSGIYHPAELQPTNHRRITKKGGRGRAWTNFLSQTAQFTNCPIIYRIWLFEFF